MKYLKENYLLILIIALAVFFRFFMFSSVPPGLYPDVAVNGTDAIHANLTGNYQIFYPANNGREGLYINLIAMSFKMFGVGIWQLRLIGALVGVFTILGLYFLSKELFGKKVALWVALFGATSFWAVSISRIGFRASLVPLVMVWGFYFLFRAIRENKWWQWTVSGIVFGAGFYSYISYKIVPLLFGLLILGCIFTKKGFLKEQWKKIIITGIIFAAIVAPIMLYQYQHKADFARTGQVSIFSKEVNKGHFFRELSVTTVKVLGMFNFYGDPNWRHNYSGFPMLNPFVGIAFLIGIYLFLRIIIRSIRKKTWPDLTIPLFLIFWLGIMLLPTVMAPEGAPHALRAIGVLPVALIIAGYGFYYFIEWVGIKFKKYQRIIIGSIIGLIIVTDFCLYFVFWAKNREVHWSFSENLTNLGQYLNDLPANTNKFVVVNEGGSMVEGVPVSAQTVKFVTYGKSESSYLNPDDVSKIRLDNSKKNVFAIMQYDDKIKKTLETRFSGKWSTVSLKTGYDTVFYIYEVY